MTLTEDSDTLNVYLSDFGVSCQIGSGTAFTGILDEPTDVIGGGLATSFEYLLTSKTTDVTSASNLIDDLIENIDSVHNFDNLGKISRGTTISVDSINYTVREKLLIDDGSFTQLLLTKV